MTAKILCRVLVNGQPCGYEPPADLTPKERLIDLLRHRDTVHLPGMREPQ